MTPDVQPCYRTLRCERSLVVTRSSAAPLILVMMAFTTSSSRLSQPDILAGAALS